MPSLSGTCPLPPLRGWPLLAEWLLLRLSRDPGSGDYGDYEGGSTNPWAHTPALAPLTRYIPGFLDRVVGRRVLDFGCGHGYQCVALAEQGATSVVGIDSNPSCLDAARELIRRRGVASTVSLADRLSDELLGTFDVVISQNSMEHFPDPAGVLAAMARAVRPGGHVVISFGQPWFAPWGSHCQFFTRVPYVNLLFPDAAVMRVRARFRSDGATRYEDIEGGLNRMTVRKFERLLTQCGLRVEYQTLDCVKGQNWLAQVPLLRELVINHIACVLQAELLAEKPPAGAEQSPSASATSPA